MVEGASSTLGRQAGILRNLLPRTTPSRTLISATRLLRRSSVPESFALSDNKALMAFDRFEKVIGSWNAL
jgi:hypothetical protein